MPRICSGRCCTRLLRSVYLRGSARARACKACTGNAGWCVLILLHLLGLFRHVKSRALVLKSHGRYGCARECIQVATRAHDPPDPRKIPAAIFKDGVARVQAGEVLELLQTDRGPVSHWWRVRRCSLADRLGVGSQENEGWILSEYTKRVSADQVAAWLDQAEGRARDWATAAHRVLSRLRHADGTELGGGAGRELLRNALLQEWDPLQRRVQRRRFVLLSGCLLKLMEVQGTTQDGRSSRWRRSTSDTGTEGGQSTVGLMYADSIDLTDEGVSVIGWGMGLGLRIQVAACRGGPGTASQKQWDVYFETTEEAENWAVALQHQIADGNVWRRTTGAAVGASSSLTAPELPSPFLLADTEPAQQLFPDALEPR